MKQFNKYYHKSGRYSFLAGLTTDAGRYDSSKCNTSRVLPASDWGWLKEKSRILSVTQNESKLLHSSSQAFGNCHRKHRWWWRILQLQRCIWLFKIIDVECEWFARVPIRYEGFCEMPSVERLEPREQISTRLAVEIALKINGLKDGQCSRYSQDFWHRVQSDMLTYEDWSMDSELHYDCDCWYITAALSSPGFYFLNVIYSAYLPLSRKVCTVTDNRQLTAVERTPNETVVMWVTWHEQLYKCLLSNSLKSSNVYIWQWLPSQI